MSTFIEAISYIGIGIYLTLMYKFLSETEPFSFYLPGGIGKFYKVHKDITTKFTDIVGSEEIKDELKAHLKYFREKNLTKGFVFQGASGCGKTYFAKAVAGESDLPFIEIFTNDLKEVHIPTVLNSVIKKYAPCIIFIDECSNILSHSRDTLLRKLDGMTEIDNVFLILATTDDIEPSMCRSGRIDKVIKFQLPTYNDRLEMFNKMGYERASKLAQQTGNFTYADISIIPREVDFINICGDKYEDEYQDKDYDERESEEYDILIKAIDLIKYGRHTSQYKPDSVTSRRLAYHEIGHLLLSYVLKDMEKPHKITIVPEGRFAGNVSFNTKDNVYKTQTDIFIKIAVLLASSVFETHYLGEYSTLCEDDFEKIDELFEILDKNQMLGYTFLRSLTDREERVAEIMGNLELIIKECITNHNDIIEQLHSELLSRETLNEKEIKEILGLDIYNSIDIFIYEI